MLLLLEYLGPHLKMVFFDRSYWTKCPFPFYIIIVSNMALLYPDNKYNNQMHSGLSWVECL